MQVTPPAFFVPANLFFLLPAQPGALHCGLDPFVLPDGNRYRDMERSPAGPGRQTLVEV